MSSQGIIFFPIILQTSDIVFTRYKEASKQLQKGEDLFIKVLSPLAHLPKGWRHVGFVCFPRIMSKDELPQDKFSKENLKVFNNKIVHVRYVDYQAV